MKPYCLSFGATTKDIPNSELKEVLPSPTRTTDYGRGYHIYTEELVSSKGTIVSLILGDPDPDLPFWVESHCGFLERKLPFDESILSKEFKYRKLKNGDRAYFICVNGRKVDVETPKEVYIVKKTTKKEDRDELLRILKEEFNRIDSDDNDIFLF